MLVSNIDISREPRMKDIFNKSRVVDINGVKVGIIGVISAETSFVSSPGMPNFNYDNAECDNDDDYADDDGMWWR